jgi:hypothetical protein
MVRLDPSVSAVYEDVRSDKSETNWLLLGYADEKGELLKVVGKGKLFVESRIWRSGRIQKKSQK